MMQTDLHTFVVINFPSVPAVPTSSRLTFVPKLTHAATKHAEIGSCRTAATVSGELLKIHHVSNNHYLDENLVLFTVNNAKLLLFNFDEIINELLEQWHHVRF